MQKCKVIAIANQKGGTGKTTTTVNLGIGLVNEGKRVLLVDCDPQSDLTTSLGWQGEDIPVTLSVLMVKMIDGCMPLPGSGNCRAITVSMLLTGR